MAQTPALHQPQPIDIDALPTRTDLLLTIFQNSPTHRERIYAIAKIKSQITSSLTELALSAPSSQTCEAVQLLFHHAVTRFLKRWRGRSQQQQRQIRYFSHVAGMAIKYYFREQAFKQLISQVTDMLDGHVERIRPALIIFLELTGSIEYCQMQAGTSMIGRCQFQRHLMGQHLNNMLILANFCIQKGLVRDGYFSEDMMADQAFQLRAPEQTLLAAFRLLRTILCFDWVGEKYNDVEQVSDWSSLVIPSKNVKQSGVPQFEKWLKNCEWVRLYQHLIAKCKSVQLKLQVIELIGDMSRIHMKFFKNKNNFKVHIENMTYSFCQILGELQLSRNSEQTIRLGIVLGRNLNKLVTGGVGSILFEINPNFFKGLLEAIRKFIIEQVIGEEIFNSNLILYYFRFIKGLVFKSRFQKQPAKFEDIEQKVREICRNYEYYIRMLFNRISKTINRKSEPLHYRLDCEQLKQNIKTYDTKQLQIYFLPFRMMKPRYASTSTIQELFVYVTARNEVMRALGLLQYFKLSDWEKDVAFQIITQSIDKIIQWFSYTSYRKKYEERQSSGGKQKSALPTITETFEEQIQNQEQYCHFLRLICFLVIDEFIEQKPLFYTGISGTLFKMIGLIIQLSYGVDLQEQQNKEMRDQSIRLKLQSALAVCQQLCIKILLRQFQLKLHNLANSQKKKYIDYQFVYWNGQKTVFQSNHFIEKVNLLDLITQYCNTSHRINRITLIKLQFYISLTIEEQQNLMNFKMSLEEYSCILQSLIQTPVLLTLTKVYFRKIYVFLQHLLLFLGHHSHQISQLVYYLTCLRIIGSIKLENISEEALNKLFVSLKCCLPLFQKADVMTEQLSEELTLITHQILLPNDEIDLHQLGEEVNKILIKNKQKMENIDLQTTCLSFPQILEFQDSSKSKMKTQYSSILQKSSEHKKLKQEPVNEIIYSGYDRGKIMQMVNRYADSEPLSAIASQNQQIDFQQSNKPMAKQTLEKVENQEEQFTLIPMDIEQPKDIIENEEVKEIIEEIGKTDKQYEHRIHNLLQPNRQNQSSEQKLIPYAAEDYIETGIDGQADYIETGIDGQADYIEAGIDGQADRRQSEKERKEDEIQINIINQDGEELIREQEKINQNYL